jgi:hypothetical protein
MLDLKGSHHVCNDISLFNADFTRQNWADLRRATPDGYRVKGSGTVEVILELDGEIASFYLDEAIYVPASQYNKISGQRLEEGFQVETEGVPELLMSGNGSFDADEYDIRPIDLVTERYAAPGRLSSPIDWSPVNTWKWFMAPVSTKPGLRTLILQLRQQAAATNA